MSKRSVDPYHQLKRLRRYMAVLELRYQHAKEERKQVLCERLANKAAKTLERIEQNRAIISVMFRRDWDEAKKMNDAFDNAKLTTALEILASRKEKKDAADNRISDRSDQGNSRIVAGNPEGESSGEDSDSSGEDQRSS